MQGQRILWETGETRHITTILNERPAILKTSAPAADTAGTQQQTCLERCDNEPDDAGRSARR